MIDLNDIRAIARRLHARSVSMAEFSENGSRVTLRIETGGEPAAAAATHAPQVVRADRLGLLRLSHPDRLPQPVREGDLVEAGQMLALLELDGETAPVCAPHRGIVVAILANESERIAYGRPLVELLPEPEEK